MRKLLLPLLALLALGGCEPAAKEVLTYSVDVDEVRLQALLNDIDGLTENALPVDAIHTLALDTPMDEELQDRYQFAFNGRDEEVQIHVWREQVDWVHLYFSTTSPELKAALETTGETYAR